MILLHTLYSEYMYRTTSNSGKSSRNWGVSNFVSLSFCWNYFYNFNSNLAPIDFLIKIDFSILKIGYYIEKLWPNCRRESFYNDIEVVTVCSPHLCSMLQGLAVPSVVLEPRLRGAVRRLVYSRLGGEASLQEMMAYKVMLVLRLLAFSCGEQTYNNNFILISFN